MRFDNRAHRFYCGVDLHARTMYLCILDQAGIIVLHKEVPAEPGGGVARPEVLRRACGSRGDLIPLPVPRARRLPFAASPAAVQLTSARWTIPILRSGHQPATHRGWHECIQ